MKLMVAGHRRVWALILVLTPLALLFGYAALRSGPLAPVPVTTTVVDSRSIKPNLFGIGTVEARFTYRVGPTSAGRVLRVDAHVGDRVQAGQLLAEIDPVDLDDRIDAQDAAIERARAETAAAEARIRDASARKAFSDAQAERYEQLFVQNVISVEAVEARRQERKQAEANLMAAQAALDAAGREWARISADRQGLIQQRASLRLTAPVDGLITARNVEPGSTVVAGQSVVELIDPGHIWVHTRFDQLSAAGLQSGLPAEIALRSRPGVTLHGTVARVEPVADAVTEEILAKVVFDTDGALLPPIGELAQVTVMRAALPTAPVLPNAAIQRHKGKLGVWVVDKEALQFTPVRTGAHDLDGQIQILDGVRVGQRVVVYSQTALNGVRRIKIVERLPGVAP